MPRPAERPEPERRSVPLYRFWHPRYWPIWLGLLFIYPLTLLPLPVQHAIGRALGRLGGRLLRKRRAIAAVNIGICFPEKSRAEIDAIVHRSFESLGIGIFELCFAWWGSLARAQRLIRINGIENLTAPLGEGRGVVLASAHLAAVEMVGLAMSAYRAKMFGLFRPVRNPFVNEILMRARSRVLADVIPKDDMRRMIRILKSGNAVWYASDQSYRRKYSAVVPFFGEPAMTSVALSHIARISGAAVVPIFFRRLDGGRGYVIDIFPALDNFPGPNPEADAVRMHGLIEAYIRLAPEQYYWIHRRFKGRPDGYPDPYADI